MPTEDPAHVSEPGRRHDRGRRRRRRDLALLTAALVVAAAAVAGAGAGLFRQFHVRPVAVAARAALPSSRPVPPASAATPEPSAPVPSPVAPAVAATAPAGAAAATPPAPDLGVKAASAVLVDLDSGAVLWQRDARTPRAPASLAKMITAMVAADLAPLDRQVTVPPAGDQAQVRKVEPNSTLMGLSAGQVFTVRDLMYGIFLVSGNDAAETLANTLTDPAHFVQLMNRKAQALGMRDSRFTNPVGLDEPGLVSTAWDLALAATAIESRYPELAAIAGVPEKVIPATAGHPALDLRSLNGVVLHYPGGTGLKTGYTDAAGYCIAATATRGGRHLLAVVLGDSQDVTDAKALLDYGFASPPGARPGSA